MNKTTEMQINKAFANVVKGIENAPDAMTLVGFTGFESHPFAVTKMDDDDFIFDKEAFQIMAYSWNREFSRKDTDPRRGIWWGGPKGVGKTTLTEQFYARLGVPVVALTCNRRIPISDFIDKMIPDGSGGWSQVPGPLKIAMMMGFPVVLNEPSRMEPSDLVAMHDIIDRGLLVCDDGEVVRAARGFVVHATDNTMGFGDDTGSYADANSLDHATLSRFLKAEVGYPEKDVEQAILVKKTGMSLANATLFVGFANAVRQAYVKGDSAITMGIREVIDWAEASMYFSAIDSEPPAMFALKRVLGGCPPEEMSALTSTFESMFGTGK